MYTEVLCPMHFILFVLIYINISLLQISEHLNVSPSQTNSNKTRFTLDLYVSCGSVVEHCVSSAKGCGFNSQGTYILMNYF